MAAAKASYHFLFYRKNNAVSKEHMWQFTPVSFLNEICIILLIHIA